MKINDTEFSFYGEIQSHSMIPHLPGTYNISSVYEKILQNFTIYFSPSFVPKVYFYFIITKNRFYVMILIF